MMSSEKCRGVFSKQRKTGHIPLAHFSVTARCPGESDADKLQTGSACPKPDSSATAPRGTPSAPGDGGLCQVILLLTDVGDITLAELLPVLPSIRGPALINAHPGAGPESADFLVLVTIPSRLSR